ncbi:MAG TPA: glycosyltransferase family 4 protein [Rubrobacter sp.]|nr:glycosyltransferase family 4 protein [Rubrobacter sp.]
MTHGYMLSGTGSNVYVQNLCRAMAREGHAVYLLCQERESLRYDFVDEHATVDGDRIESLGEQQTSYAGRCIVYNPEIDGLLPVYVYDDYAGWRVKTFLDLTDEELDNYLRRNVEAVQTVLDVSDAEAVITNHSVPGPLIARRALEETNVPYASIVHGSCLQYVSRKSEKYMGLTREGLQGAREILALSSHSAGTIAEDFPDLSDKTRSLPGGVDTELFRPDALDRGVIERLNGGPGRGPEQRASLRGALESSGNAGELAEALRVVAASYDARSHDKDAGERLSVFLDREGPLVVYIGKLIHSKGVHSLISAFSRVRKETDARLLVVGFGTFREGLEALTHSLSAGDETTVERLAELGRLLDGGPAGPLEHFELADELLDDARGIEDDVLFTGPLYHDELAKLLPVADVGVVPSIFPETFGLVAAELAASSVVPFVADHSGLREAGEIVGRTLPFDLRIGMDGFEENLASALTDYLRLPDEERRRCEEVVRHNSVEHLSWATLGQDLVALLQN